MTEPTLTDLIRAANAPLTDPERNRQTGAGRPRFELWHHGLSLCSMKVRATLMEKGAPFLGHDIHILPPRYENYHPDYVRLRMQGQQGRDLVDGYTGRSSVRTEGFDPAVVPTLVDLEEERVYTDSVDICEHVNRAWPSGPDLVPQRLRREIEREVAAVDGMPHVALLYGAHPDGDLRPVALRTAMKGIHDVKIRKLMEGRSLAVGHPRLTAAYDAKIRKEAAARTYVATPDMMRAATAETVRIVGILESRLGDGRAWACGDAFTLADLFWAVSLWRLNWLGYALMWEGGHALNAEARPRVAAYAARLFARESVRAAVIDWPGIPESEHVAPRWAPPKPVPPPLPASRRVARPLDGHGRDVREESLTAAVLATFRDTPDARTKTVLSAFARHLHAFLEEVQPTEEEWEYGIEFLTRTGHLSAGGRQEFVLLSDVMGATARVDLINHRFPGGATENSVLGPFFVEDRPAFDNGADISGGIRGEPMFFNARVLDTEGRPIPGARVDIWHADGDGGYDIMMTDRDEAAMRGLFRSDAQGRVWFLSILPASYPIPEDGTVGDLLRAANRSPIRPGHVHVRIEAPGYRRLTTMLFLDGDPYLDADPVFGVKQSLVMPFERRERQRAPDGRPVPSPAWCVDYDFVLARKER